MADGPDGPLPEPETVCRTCDIDPRDAEALLGWVVRDPGWLESTAVELTTLMVGQGLRKAVDAGRVRYVPTRLSAIPRLLCGRLRPTVTVLGAHEDGGGWRLAGSPGWAAVAAANARKLVIERWPGPARPGAEPLAAGVAGIAGVFDRVDPPDPPPANQIGDDHRRIGGLVASLIPEGATVQWGPGAIGASVVAALHRPVRVRSGLVTDELADLADRGLLIGTAEAAYAWGGPRLKSMVDAGSLVLHPVSYIHDITALSATPSFVAINTAIQVGLDGSVNVESVAGRVVAGPGGHPDFAAGASRSPCGVSIVALISTAGGASTIVRRVDVTSTPRSDVDVVVTEHGVADLRHCTDSERAACLIEIADPKHRRPLAENTPRR
jgi:acyl-CoA hydrolase